MERLNWMGDRSPKGLWQSAGMMINYRYDLARIDTNHESYRSSGRRAISSAIKAFLATEAQTVAIYSCGLGGLIGAELALTGNGGHGCYMNAWGYMNAGHPRRQGSAVTALGGRGFTR